MKLSDKKYIPYYIVGTLIIILSISIVFLLSYRIKENEQSPTTEIPTQPEITTLFMNGEIPYYPNIAASAFVKEKFELIDGRIVYNDPDVFCSTGIDVSSFQGDIDWNAVAADGIDFAIIRVGLRGYGAKGSLHEDDHAIKNIRGASKAGLMVGVYFYSQAITVNEAIEEASLVLKIIEKQPVTGPVVFDWENEPDKNMRTDNLDSKTLTDCAVAFCEIIKNAGYTPAVYFNLTDAYVRYNLNEIKDYVFWFAQHEGTFPAFYYKYNIWQYSDSGKVNGIDGNVDLNIMFHSGKTLL